MCLISSSNISLVNSSHGLAWSKTITHVIRNRWLNAETSQPKFILTAEKCFQVVLMKCLLSILIFLLHH